MSEVEIKNNFSKNIKDLRVSRKLNQIQLGELIHYSSKAISKWENGDVLPDIVTLNMLANFFNVTVDDLISTRNVVRRSHRKLNRFLITLSSCLLSFVIAAVMFMILYICNVIGAWKAFMVALPCASITFIVFSALWYKRVVLNIAVLSLIWGSSLMVMSFMNFDYFWVVLVIAGFLSITSVAFFNIRFGSKKDVTDEQ